MREGNFNSNSTKMMIFLRWWLAHCWRWKWLGWPNIFILFMAIVGGLYSRDLYIHSQPLSFDSRPTWMPLNDVRLFWGNAFFDTLVFFLYKANTSRLAFPSCPVSLNVYPKFWIELLTIGITIVLIQKSIALIKYNLLIIEWRCFGHFPMFSTWFEKRTKRMTLLLYVIENDCQLEHPPLISSLCVFLEEDAVGGFVLLMIWTIKPQDWKKKSKNQ